MTIGGPRRPPSFKGSNRAWGAGMLETDQVVATGALEYPADRTPTGLQHDPAAGLSVLHVVVKAGPTNSQYNEHCLPVMAQRRITVCSLFPAEVEVPPDLVLVQGDGSVLGCFRALRDALALSAYDVVHVHAAASGALALAVYAASRRSRRNLVFTVHTSWPNLRPRNRFFMLVIAALFPVVVACSEASLESLPRIVKRLAGPVEVVPNGVDIGRVDRAAAGSPPLRAPRTGRLVVSVGRLIAVKDPGTVLDAFARVARPDDLLVMVGEGDLFSSYADQGDVPLGAGLVRFTGLLQRDEVYRLLHQADVFVSASRVEGMPVAVLEAMASRCPVVISDIAPHREIASRTPGVRLVAPGDVAGFADAIGRAVDLPAAERQQVGEELRRGAAEHFSVGGMNQAYGRLYRRIADAAPERTSRPRLRVRVLPVRLLPGRLPPVRRLGYVTACALVGAGAAFAYGTLHPQMYDADVTLAVGDDSTLLTDDALSDGAGSAADLAGLVDRQPVLEPVARRLGVADWRSLRARVHGQTSTDDPLLFVVSASSTSAQGAVQLAKAVSQRLAGLTARPAAAAFHPGFPEHELDRIPLEIDSTKARLDALLARRPGPGGLDPAHQRAVADLRTSLTDLQTGYQSMLEWRSASSHTQGVTISGRTAGRPAPPLPRPSVLAVAGGAAGACLWLAFVLLLRRDERTPG